VDPRNFFAELKRRNVYKVAVAYTVVGWLLVQIATQVFPFFEIPTWAVRLVVLVIIIGFPIALIIAWAFELTPEGLKRSEGADAAPARASTHRAWIYVVIAAGMISIGLFFLGRYLNLEQRENAEVPAKSIAVLPFENLSEEKGNAYFAEGIQDEILTRLAKIADLKVISRTSTHRYKSSPEDLPKIAQQLGVAHILEGSVQKAGDQVRVTVQLIRTATDAHLWAETYDRKLTDIFAVESEIAENIAKSLRARLTGAEQQAVAAKPTENPEAYEAYLRGLALWNKLQTSPQDLETTTLYFARAVQLDPKFVLAWAHLCAAHTFNYAEFDRTPQRLSQAKQALDNAMRLAPELGDTQFALGMYRYRGLGDYEGALAAFQKARDQAANRVEAIEFSAYVKRRQGKWNDALRLHDESLKLDPRNPILLSEAALTYRALRRFNGAHALVDRALEIESNSALLLVQKAEIYAAEGDLTAAGRVLERVPLDGRDPILFTARLRYWMFLRQYDEAIRETQHVIDGVEKLPKAFVASYRAWLGIVRTLAGDIATAKSDLNQARDELVSIRAQGDTGLYVARNLILVSGFLGDKAVVDREAAQLSDEIKNDAFSGPDLTNALAQARAHLGETDTAIAAVKDLLNFPGERSLTPALLRADPLWDPLRREQRFQKLANSHP
jgi:TolB-like protein/Tfp pilus assembly protein PilF